VDGVGYYARARNLRACAQALVAHHGGEFPEDIEAVTALQGSDDPLRGILALSRGRRHPILDGNVRRVLARCSHWRGSELGRRRCSSVAAIRCVHA